MAVPAGVALLAASAAAGAATPAASAAAGVALLVASAAAGAATPAAGVVAGVATPAAGAAAAGVLVAMEQAMAMELQVQIPPVLASAMEARGQDTDRNMLINSGNTQAPVQEER